MKPKKPIKLTFKINNYKESGHWHGWCEEIPNINTLTTSFEKAMDSLKGQYKAEI